MAVLNQKSHARSETRSIAASLKAEGQTLTHEQIGVLVEVIDGKRDAGREIRGFTFARDVLDACLVDPAQQFAEHFAVTKTGETHPDNNSHRS